MYVGPVKMKRKNIPSHVLFLIHLFHFFCVNFPEFYAYFVSTVPLVSFTSTKEFKKLGTKDQGKHPIFNFVNLNWKALSKKGIGFLEVNLQMEEQISKKSS